MAEITWTSLIAGMMFLLLKKARLLRITNAVEVTPNPNPSPDPNPNPNPNPDQDVGIDLCKTGGSAYSFEGNGDPALGDRSPPARARHVGISMQSVHPVDANGSPAHEPHAFAR